MGKDAGVMVDLLCAIVDNDKEAALAAAALLGMGEQELEALRADVERAPITEDELDEVLHRVATAAEVEEAFEAAAILPAHATPAYKTDPQKPR